ncbi:hypothetical protein RQL62_17855 [Citrobacter amalonaticus]|nr:hypothetical protein [Citrobacter amalonaticus]
MTTITRERIAQYANDPRMCNVNDEIRQIARIALASLTDEPVAWIVHARTGDQLTTDGGYVANAEGILGLHSTPLYTAPPAPDNKQTDELVMWVKRLAHSLRKANPDSKLQNDAMDYLSRKGLISVEDVLR